MQVEPCIAHHAICSAIVLVGFFTRDPQFEVAYADVTASFGTRAVDEITVTRQALRERARECDTAKTNRDAAERKLRRVMRQVIVILGATIDATDSRWHVFGLNQPRPVGRRSMRHRSGAESLSEPIPFIPHSPDQNIAAA